MAHQVFDPILDKLGPVGKAIQGVGAGVTQVFRKVVPGAKPPTQPRVVYQDETVPTTGPAQAELIAGVSNTTLLLVGAGLTVGLIVFMNMGKGKRRAGR